MSEQILQNGISKYLPLLLLIIGLGLLAFCVIWAVLQFRTMKQSGSKVASSRSAEDDPAIPGKQDLENEQIRRLEDVIQMQKLQISSMGRQLDDAAKLRHDFRQELLILQEFARSGDREALERYLPHVKLEGRNVTVPLCPNPLVNTVLQFYFSKARAAGIEIDAAIQADESFWLTAADVGVLFGNLLENAVTAAAEAPAASRRLRIRTTQTKSGFVIAMGNTYGIPRSVQENGSFASTKPDHTGIGLDSIRAVARRYDGDAKFRIDGEMFMSYVILFRPRTSESDSDGGRSL